MSRRSEGSAREGCAGWVGIALLLLASLLLTSTPQEVYRWSHRNGYTRTEIEVLSPPDSHLRWMSVRVLSTGQKLSIKRNSFTGPRDRQRLPARDTPAAPRAPGPPLSVERNSFAGSRDRKRLPAWYNPDARWALGITIFDERLVSAEDNAELPDAGSVFGLLLVTVASALLGVFLLRSPAQDRKSSTK